MIWVVPDLSRRTTRVPGPVQPSAAGWGFNPPVVSAGSFQFRIDPPNRPETIVPVSCSKVGFVALLQISVPLASVPLRSTANCTAEPVTGNDMILRVWSPGDG